MPHNAIVENFVDSGRPNLHVGGLPNSNVSGMPHAGEHLATNFDEQKQLISGVGNLSLPHDMVSNFGGQEAPIWVRERKIVGVVQSDVLGMGDVQPLHTRTFPTLVRVPSHIVEDFLLEREGDENIWSLE